MSKVRRITTVQSFMAAKRESSRNLEKAIQKESKRWEDCYLWIQKHMPASFFEEVSEENLLQIAHTLMNLNLQDYFAHIHLKHSAIALCLDSHDADLRILKLYQNQAIITYRIFISNEPPPFPGVTTPLRIATLFFSQFPEKADPKDAIDPKKLKEIFHQVKEKHPEMTDSKLNALLENFSPIFLRSVSLERLVFAFDMACRAKGRDQCQYEVRYNEEWKEKKETPSMQIVFAWHNVPKHGFLYQMAKLIHRHGLTMSRVNATYLDPFGKDSTLLMSVGLDGAHNKPAWEEADIPDFLQEFATLKYFSEMETIEQVFVDSGWVRGNIGNLIKTMVYFVHQALVHADANMYSLDNIEEALCRHPELTVQITRAFEAKFHPEQNDIKEYEKMQNSLLRLVDELDTGNEINDMRRKNILRQTMSFVTFTLKTNFYCTNKTAFCFRLDPAYLDALPYERKEKFPEMPFAIFFMKGMSFIGFHIRFKDLSRGGLRTILPQRREQTITERNNVFAECYNLAYTQQKKNKDIPEGGAKGVIFLEPSENLKTESEIYKSELETAQKDAEEIEKKIREFESEFKLEYLYQTQRAYVESFITLINCEGDGQLKAKNIIDYWKKPEYIYLGPDENMHNPMIEWIANYSKWRGYKPGSSFITSKPGAGINHKDYGVTSLGVNVYMEEALKFLGIEPQKEEFTVKISGGPDGDVAGNQILNLAKYYPKTAKLLALTDVSGTIYDPKGLDLEELSKLFHDVKPIRYYPPEKLSEGGFLLDLFSKRESTPYMQQTLCWRRKGNKVIEEWLSGNEMNHLYRHNVHATKTDIFIPGGGRPRTLNESNYKDFLDETGKPTSLAIVEGANLYLTPRARRALEDLGVLIIKDSSANKGGVICSSFEVLCGLVLSDEEFIKQKAALMKEILAIIRDRARDEGKLLLTTYATTGAYLTDLSDLVSARINTFKYQILDFLEPYTLSKDPNDPLIRCLLNYCPPLLLAKYRERILDEIPDIHKKAIIACYIASRVVYSRGLDWSPTIVDVLPLIARDPIIIGF